MSKGKKILLSVEVIILLLLIGGLFLYGQVNQKLDKIATPKREDFREEQIVVNTEAPELTGYTNIALFALDHRKNNAQYANNNSDTIIIASINNDTKDIKLVSVYRDSFLDIAGGNYQKCNSAYANGGPQQALSMLNSNLDLNLKDYVTVDFTAMVKAIDLLGGLDIPMTYQELVHINNYCVETSEESDTDYTPIPLPDPKPENETEILDVYHLNGVQATSYCRIRYTSSMDFGRTQRQRMVIQMMVEKAKKSSISTLSDIMDEVFPYIETSFSKSEILKLGMGVLSYSVDETTGFPNKNYLADIEGKGSVVIPSTLELNVRELHKFLFPDESYTPSRDVKDRSEEIVRLTGYGEGGSQVDKLLDEEEKRKEADGDSKEGTAEDGNAVIQSPDTNTQNPESSMVWQENNNYVENNAATNGNYDYNAEVGGNYDYDYNYNTNGGENYDYSGGMNENYSEPNYEYIPENDNYGMGGEVILDNGTGIDYNNTAQDINNGYDYEYTNTIDGSQTGEVVLDSVTEVVQ